MFEPLAVAAAAPWILIPADVGGVGSITVQLAKPRDRLPRPDFEHHLALYDLVPDSLGGEKLEKYRWVLNPGDKAIGVAGPSAPCSPARPA
ncbi:hypothetical protein [Streptomyces sp. NBC_00076]|uniref:hypothetical protein n=1 Tax=Streptomyces sp. NBC_00076 TaxID=2975642 RepID=UPI003244516D